MDSAAYAPTRRIVLIQTSDNECALFWTAGPAQDFLDATYPIYDEDGSRKYPICLSLEVPKYWYYDKHLDATRPSDFTGEDGAGQIATALMAEQRFLKEVERVRMAGGESWRIEKPRELIPPPILRIHRLNDATLWQQVHAFPSFATSIRRRPHVEMMRKAEEEQVRRQRKIREAKTVSSEPVRTAMHVAAVQVGAQKMPEPSDRGDAVIPASTAHALAA